MQTWLMSVLVTWASACLLSVRNYFRTCVCETCWAIDFIPPHLTTHMMQCLFLPQKLSYSSSQGSWDMKVQAPPISKSEWAPSTLCRKRYHKRFTSIVTDSRSWWMKLECRQCVMNKWYKPVRADGVQHCLIEPHSHLMTMESTSGTCLPRSSSIPGLKVKSAWSHDQECTPCVLHCCGNIVH